MLETSGICMSPKISKFDHFPYFCEFYILQHLVVKRSMMPLKRTIPRAIDVSLKQCFAVLNYIVRDMWVVGNKVWISQPK